MRTRTFSQQVFVQQKSLKLWALAFTLFIFCGWITDTMASSFVKVLSKFYTSSAFELSVGWKGASIFIFFSLSASMSASQGWFRISRMPSLVPILFAGSFSSRAEMKFWQSWDMLI